MIFVNAIIAALSAAAAFYSLQILDAPPSFILCGAFGLLACYALTLPSAGRKREIIVRLGGL